MALSPAYGATGTGTGFIIPASASGLIPFADNTARDTWASGNLTDLVQNQSIVSVTGAPDTWYLWRGDTNPGSYDNTNWEVFTTVVRGGQGPQGVPGNTGSTGAPGADAPTTMFVSESARDTFYSTQTNRDNLNNGDIITVNIGSNTVEFQQWLGTSAPTSYSANNFIPVSLRTSTASIDFADKLRIFDFGEIPAFDDRINSITALAIGQRYTVGGGSLTARQLNFPAESTLLTVPAGTNSALQQVHTYTFDTTGIITNPAIALESVINFSVAPNFYIVEIFQGTDDTGTRVFRERLEPNGVAGNFTARTDGIGGNPSAQRFLPNTTYFFRLTGDIDFQFVQGVGVSSPAGTITGFEFTFEDLATQNWVNNNAAIAIQDEGVELTTKGITLDFVGDGVTATGTGTTKTITIPGGGVGGITVQDEGNPLTALATTFNFTGAGVTATGNASTKTINIPGGGGATGVNIQDEGNPLASVGETLNFEGAGVTATGGGVTKTITIPGGIQGLTIQEEGNPLTALGTTINFVGPAVTASGTGAVKTITFTGISGISVEDEGNLLTNEAQVLNFVGDGVTATGTTTEKTITIPGGISGLIIQDEGNPLTTAATTLNFAGTGVVASGTGAAKTITISTNPASIPSLHNFSIDIPSRVDLDTDLNVQHIVSFDVSNYSHLTGLELIVTNGTNITLTLPVRDGQQSQTITLAGTVTSSPGTVTFQLSGAHPEGTALSNIVTVQIADVQSSEQAYYGARPTNDFSSVTLGTLSPVDVTNSGTVYVIGQQLQNGEILGILSPDNRDPTSIIDTVLNQESIGNFTATLAVRVINSVNYNLLTITNNSGFTGTFNFRVTTE